MFDKVLNMPLDFLRCFAMVLKQIHGNVDTCQTYYSIPPNQNFTSFRSHTWKYNIQVNKSLTKVKRMTKYSILYFCSFIFLISMSQTIRTVNRSGAYYFLHALNQWCVCWCVHVRSHTSRTTHSHLLLRQEKIRPNI